MDVRLLHFVIPCLITLSLTSCSRIQTAGGSGTAPSSSDVAFAPLLNRIWRVSHSPSGPAAGSIYVFLQNGTLLETSCVETYRIATWSLDKSRPNTLRVVEDQQPVFSVRLGDAAGNTLLLRQTLVHNGETRDVTLTASDTEFVCPDLPK